MLDEDGEVVGFTGAQPWPHDDFGPVGEIEIGWRLARSAWGRGYATAAARTTLERVRAAGVERVVAMVNSRNERSIAVARRLGMELAETFTTPVSQQSGYCFRLELGGPGRP
jgi:RimJ/RimL family protein N-acetyltransferase